MPTTDSRYPETKPFLSWAGSKRKLIKHLLPYVPSEWGKYYEPFLGGGALFFHIGPASAEVSDASSALIATYKAVKREPEKVLGILRPLTPSKKEFERQKRLSIKKSYEKAAQFIFLNKACWNGLYRVNSEGIFNVPYGMPRTDFVVNEENFLKCSMQLRKREVSVKHQDFEAIIDKVERNDFVFLDPPYVTSHNMNGFVDWNEKLFSWSDQIRLAAMAKKLVKKGANVLITNADHPDILQLYSDFYGTTFTRSSTLASDTSKRKVTSEAVFFGGPAYNKRGLIKQKTGDNNGREHRAYRPD